MKIREIENKVQEINQCIMSKPWLDFEIMQYVGYDLRVMGSVDPSITHDIEIVFNQVFFACAPMEWKTDTSKTAICVVIGEDAAKLNRRFQVEEGYVIFKFFPEDYPEDFGCYIGAKSIDYELKKP